MDEEKSKLSNEREQSEGTITRRTNRRLGECLNKAFVVIGLILLVGALGAVPYVALQIVRCSLLAQNLACTYVALAIIPFGMAFFLYVAYQYWVTKRRTVESSELEGLYSEIERYRPYDSKDQLKLEVVKQAESEKKKLKSLNRPIFELDALPLRQVLVDMYQPVAELIAKTRDELEYLEQYTVVVAADRINGIIKDLEKILGNGAEEDGKQGELERRLRADLKSLRDTSAWYDRTWAIGEWMHTCVTCWACATVLVTMLVGILPIIHSQGNWSLCIVHWAVLGTTGALLYILIRLHKLDVPEVGETEGKELLQGTIRSIGIGALAAVLLYASIWGGALEGVILPVLPISQAHSEISKFKVRSTGGETQGYESENRVGGNSSEQNDVNKIPVNKVDARIDERPLKDVGLSIFWAIFAGLSPVILRRMSQVAESSLGELKSEGGE